MLDEGKSLLLSLSYAQKVGVRVPPLQKVGVRVRGYPPVGYVYAGQRRSVGSFSAIAGLLVSLSVKLSYTQVV